MYVYGHSCLHKKYVRLYVCIATLHVTCTGKKKKKHCCFLVPVPFISKITLRIFLLLGMFYLLCSVSEMPCEIYCRFPQMPSSNSSISFQTSLDDNIYSSIFDRPDCMIKGRGKDAIRIKITVI